MRLLIADKLHPRAIEELSTLPVEVVYEPELTKESLETAHAGGGHPRRALHRSHRGGNRASAKQLNLIVRAGASSTRSTSARRASAASTSPTARARTPRRWPSSSSGSMVALDRRIPDAVASLRAGKWERQEYSKAEGLHGKTLGIAGLGAIGREVAQRARCFGLNVVGLEPLAHAARAATELGVGHARVDRGARARRATSCRCTSRSTDATRHIVNRAHPRPPAGAGDAHQHRPRRPRRLRGAARGRREARPPRGARRVSRTSRAGSKTFAASDIFRSHPSGGPRLRHAAHRGGDRSGAAGHRHRDGARHPLVPARGDGAERRQRVARRRRRASSSSSG